MPILSTYRLQFHKGFTFDDATAIVPYLHRLGVTHVYASPYFKAAAGSTHGYDVIDHSTLNPEVGDASSFKRFVDALKANGMSQVLDIVPNHMGVDTNDNAWWNDLLRNGRHSKYADFFDVDFDSQDGKVLLPVLGKSIGEAIDAGEITTEMTPTGPVARYYSRIFPMTPGTDVSDSSPGGIEKQLAGQNFRLCHWKAAPDEINYRRFFDVTSLAAIRMERPEVFDAANRYTIELVKNGTLVGLRCDHPDGLLDPKGYLVRLHEAAGEIPVWVEKILSTGEKLRPDWPVAGTSGYDFLIAVNALYVDPAREPAIEQIYANYTGLSEPFQEIVYHRKWRILEESLASELTSLTGRLKKVAESHRRTRDYTFRQLRAALQSTIASFGVYRTYVTAGEVTDTDVRDVRTATDRAKRRIPNAAEGVFDFIADAVLLKLPVDSLAFAQKFQQLTSPATAKGVEDTAFYVFNRMTSLNEVGGDPGRFGCDAGPLHEYLTDRQQHWPAALSCLSTHDTKRSEDVRARISVLSEIPDQWQAALKSFDVAVPKTDVSANDRYLLYQTLLGSWVAGDPPEGYAKRIEAYMLKAIREAKAHTSWTQTNQPYEDAVKTLVADLILNQAGKPFRDAVAPLLETVTRVGYLNSLSQTLVRLTAPGVPDTYQGTELWDFSLVDPDNRRPVDYAKRASVLAEVIEAKAADLFNSIADGRIKLWLTHKLLQARATYPELFTKGQYTPLRVTGRHARSVFAFARTHGDQTAVVVAGRLLSQVNQWGDTAVELPASSRPFRSALGDLSPGGGRVGDLFVTGPTALLIAAG